MSAWVTTIQVSGYINRFIYHHIGYTTGLGGENRPLEAVEEGKREMEEWRKEWRRGEHRTRE